MYNNATFIEKFTLFLNFPLIQTENISMNDLLVTTCMRYTFW